ncbi:hypothetical protein [Thermotoga sp. KOL6]|uniref:hypothetical protein n=1 Tax=Thermotoga sp. KOL6 TaxID=126741 RepID=UPI0011AF5CA4|nr:hypothetical protein [Thermotoga sp. KOL6]
MKLRKKSVYVYLMIFVVVVFLLEGCVGPSSSTSSSSTSAQVNRDLDAEIELIELTFDDYLNTAKVDYKITNTGKYEIDIYTVYFIVTCQSGTEITKISGSHGDFSILPGTSKYETAYIDLGENVIPLFVEVTKLELWNYEHGLHLTITYQQ